MKKVTNAEWQQILSENPTNADLRYIIEYTDKKEEAASQLLKQNPTNDDLRYIIRFTDKKEEAQAILDSRMEAEKPQEKKGKMLDIIKSRN